MNSPLTCGLSSESRTTERDLHRPRKGSRATARRRFGMGVRTRTWPFCLLLTLSLSTLAATDLEDTCREAVSARFRSRVLLGAFGGAITDPRVGLSLELPMHYSSLIVRTEILAGLGRLIAADQKVYYSRHNDSLANTDTEGDILYSPSYRIVKETPRRGVSLGINLGPEAHYEYLRFGVGVTAKMHVGGGKERITLIRAQSTHEILDSSKVDFGPTLELGGHFYAKVGAEFGRVEILGYTEFDWYGTVGLMVTYKIADFGRPWRVTNQVR